MVSTLIFDLDGTLLNTLDDLHDSVCYALQQVGMPLLDKKDTRRFLGNGIANLVAKSVTHVAPMADDALKARTLEIFRAYYVKHSMDKTLPYEGVLPMLAECKRHGLFTAIVSNKLDPAVKDLHKMFFADYIDIAIGETPAVKRKPAPDMVWRALKEMNGEIEEALVVGDMTFDVDMAHNAGCKACAVTYGNGTREQLASADWIIDDFAELLQKMDS